MFIKNQLDKLVNTTTQRITTTTQEKQEQEKEKEKEQLER